ncbi:MAG: hypothetical protein COA33_010250 [Fluviicola sp.]|nr:hypothetical protein [Fluviicola sp.]
MKHIQQTAIDKAIDKIDNLEDDGLERVAETFALAQQTLLGYAMSAAQEYKNEQLEGLIIYYFCLISEAFVQEKVFLNAVSEDDIDAFEEPFFEVLDQYFDTDDEEVLNDFIDQPELIRFMMIEISTKDDDGSSLDDETATQLFIVTAAMISLMNKAIKE